VPKGRIRTFGSKVIRYVVVFATTDCLLLHNRRSITLETERRAVEREVFVRHRANRGLHLDPWATLPEAAAARLRRVGLGRRRHHKAPCQLAHETDADARRVALVTRHSGPTRNHTPAAVGQHKRPFVRLQFLQVLVESLLALLRLDDRLPPPLAVVEVTVEGEALVECLVPLA